MEFAWNRLEKPFFVLAPMEGATDTVFRQVVASCGAPDVFVTEFTNVEGMFSKGSDHVMHRLKFSTVERPIIAQIWGTKPESFVKASKLVCELGFDGVDVNFGCPERSIFKSGACAALIHNPKLACEIISAIKEGAGTLPVSVKTRIGVNTIEIGSWIPLLLEQKLDALTIHLRTAKEMSDVPAHWELAKEIVTMKDSISPNTVLIGNGDIVSIPEGTQKAKESGMDGIMIGRGVFHNPYVFNPKVDYQTLSKEKKIELLLFHLDLYEKTWGDKKRFAPLKRFFKIYITGFDGASELREKLMETESIEGVRRLLKTCDHTGVESSTSDNF